MKHEIYQPIELEIVLFGERDMIVTSLDEGNLGMPGDDLLDDILGLHN